VCCSRADCLTDQRERTKPTTHEDRSPSLPARPACLRPRRPRAAQFGVVVPGRRQVSTDEAERPDVDSDDDPAGAPDELERELTRLRHELTQLRQALESRPVIDQARGMVMAIGPCTPEAAWRVLVEASQRTNTKLRRVAEALVASTDGTTPIPLPMRAALAASLRTHRNRPAK
jgi:hypothetical protein